MKRLALALCLLAPLPAQADGFDCSLARSCVTDGGCKDDADPVVLAVTIADDGQSAQLSFGDQSLMMTLVDDSDMGRTFLALRDGSGVGVMTLKADGAFAAASNEFTNGALIGAASTGRCTPRNG